MNERRNKADAGILEGDDLARDGAAGEKRMKIQGVNRNKKITLVLALVVLIWGVLCGRSVQAAESGIKTVRVGWYQSDLFQEGMTDEEVKSGYSYDYLQKIADYTSWDYEYVYGDWTELYEMLEKGEIDFLCGVSKTEGRKRAFLFPDSEMGTEQYYLYKRSDDVSISGDDLETLNGKKVGLITNNLMSVDTEEWLAENGLDVELVYYDSFGERDAALESGAIDLKTTTYDGAISAEEITAITKVGEEPYYVAVSKDRKDLLEELNAALSTMISIDPYVLQSLKYQNYGSLLAGKTISDGERKWLSGHSTIVIGYLDNYLPYSNQNEDGEAEGLVTDALTSAFAALGLTDLPEMEYIAYESYEALTAALTEDVIDLAFPVTNDSWRLEQERINASAEVVSDSGTLFYKSANQKQDIQKIAVNESNELQIEYTQRVYPEAELVYYPNIDACLEGILKGEADGTIMDTMRVQYVTAQSRYSALSYVQLSASTGKCFGVKEGNAELLLLLNRAIKVLGTSYGIDYSYQYISTFYSYGPMDFIKDNLILFIVIIGAVIALTIFLLVRNLQRKEQEVEEKERLQKEAETASRAKSVFLFNMSHDIRTPMNAVLGFANLMEKELDQPEKLKDHLAKIKMSGEYLLGLINNVLEVARIDSGKEVLNESFADLLNEQYSVLLENDLRKKNLTFIKDLTVEHRYVYADAYKIQEIMLNLLSNAVKYTPDGGRIRMGLQEYPCEKPGHATYVATVSDNGIGMTKEFQEQIFESFTREKNTTESKILGTGLGMSIVKRLVDLMGGTVEVQSAPGKGSTFTITVDLRVVEDPERFLSESTKEQEAAGDLSGLRILLAEDNELNAEIAIAILEDAGASTEHACDGVECVNMLLAAEDGYYDLILMDIQMPNLNGYDATRKIRRLEDSAKASIPIVAMTANAFDEDRKDAENAGMNGHIAKPIDVKEMIRTIRGVVK